MTSGGITLMPRMSQADALLWVPNERTWAGQNPALHMWMLPAWTAQRYAEALARLGIPGEDCRMSRWPWGRLLPFVTPPLSTL